MGAKEQRTIYDKLSTEVRQAILGDARTTLSVLELNKILEEKTIDWDLKGPFPYKACPKCGSTALKGSSATDNDRDEVYYFIRCSDCEWGEWSQ